MKGKSGGVGVESWRVESRDGINQNTFVLMYENFSKQGELF